MKSSKAANLIASRLIMIAATLVCVVTAQQESSQQQPQSLPIGQTPAPLQAPTASNCTTVTTKPTPKAVKYNLDSCIVLQFASYISINDGKQFVELNNGVVNKNSSNCENSTNTVTPKITITFDCGELSFDIAKNNSYIYVEGIVGSYIIPTTNNTENIEFANSSALFSTTETGHYYKCNSAQHVNIRPNESLVFSDFALEAYRTAKGVDFYKVEEECPLDLQPVSDLVRIGVGICLVALVAIVLIAYFIGRRRWSERSSYESV